MRSIDRSSQFKRDVKKAMKQTSPKPNLDELKNVMAMLAEDKPLPLKNEITIWWENGQAIVNAMFSRIFY